MRRATPLKIFHCFLRRKKSSNFNENILTHDSWGSKNNFTARLGKNKLIKLIFSSLVKNEKNNLLAALKSSFILNNSLVLSNSLKEKLLLNVKWKRDVRLAAGSKDYDAKFLFLFFGNIFLKKADHFNWILSSWGGNRVGRSPLFKSKEANWILSNEGFMDLQNSFSNLFKVDVRLSFYSATSVFSEVAGIDFLKNFNKTFKSVFKSRQLNPALRFGYFLAFCAFRFRSPELITTFLSDAIEMRRDHYSVISPFFKLLKYLKLSTFGLAGFRLGFYGRINGRDRKFRYYLTKGSAPALRSILLKVDYSEDQCVGVYGVVHIHAWMYRY